MLGLEHLVNNRACRIIAPTGEIALLLVDRQHVAAEKVAVIPYGFDRSKFNRVQAETVQAERLTSWRSMMSFTIATFGRLYSDKGHRYVIEALPTVLLTVPNLRYLIVGDGAERRKLEQQVHDLRLDTVVTFLGWRHDVPELMAAVDVVVQPSLQEAFSQSMAEALFMGRPLSRPMSVGHQNWFRTTRSELSCRAETHWRSVVHSSNWRTTHYAKCHGDCGKRHAYANFTIEAIAPRYGEIYNACTTESWATGGNVTYNRTSPNWPSTIFGSIPCSEVNS